MTTISELMDMQLCIAEDRKDLTLQLKMMPKYKEILMDKLSINAQKSATVEKSINEYLSLKK